MSAILKFLSLFNELYVVVHTVVQVVEQTAPQGTEGAKKFDAAMTAVHSVVNAAPAAASEFQNAKAALESGDAGVLSSSVGHMIEIAVSVSKTFGLFPKAGIVQNAEPLNIPGSSAG